MTAAFLTWKHAGWRTFFEFAANRSNTADLGAWTRAWRHAGLWADLNFRWPAVPVVLALLALAGVARRREPFWLACAAYFVASTVAFARHSFFLDRLQLAAGLVLVVLAAIGLAGILARLEAARPGAARPLGGLAVAVAAAVTLASGPVFDRQHAQLFPPRNERLAEASAAVGRIMADHDAAIVVGTFNNFSAPWTRLLWHRTRGGRPRTGLVTEFDYPLPRGRSGLDPAWDPRYARHLEERLRVIGAPVAITLEPYPDAPWRDGDYCHWNEWKRNYVTALRAHPDVHLVREIDLPNAQLTVGVHRIGGPRVHYAEGWGPPEGWGRWCVARRATVEVPVSAAPSVCVIRAAAWGGLTGVQRCRVLHADTLLAEFTVAPVPWRFADYEVPIGPQAAARIALTLECTGLWPAGPADPRPLALAVQDVFVR